VKGTIEVRVLRKKCKKVGGDIRGGEKRGSETGSVRGPSFGQIWGGKKRLKYRKLESSKTTTT